MVRGVLVLLGLLVLHDAEAMNAGGRHRRPGGVASFASDNFNGCVQNPVTTGNDGITWNQAGTAVDAGASNWKCNSNGVQPDSSAFEDRVMWGTFGPARGQGQYACAKSAAAAAVSGEQLGVCVAISNGGGAADDLFCCKEICTTGSPCSNMNYATQICEDGTCTFGSTLVTGDNPQGNPATGIAFYLGVERDSTTATTFRCYESTDGSTWTQKGSTQTGIANINVPGNPGVYVHGSQFDGIIPTWDQFQAGDGNPFSGTWSNFYGNPCGQN